MSPMSSRPAGRNILTMCMRSPFSQISATAPVKRSPATRWMSGAFIERMRSRLRNHCQEDHQSWPAKGRYTRHIGEATCRRRMDAYAADVRALRSTYDQDQSPRLGLVDLATDEIKQLSDFDSHVYGRDKINA
jgi:hypothetical protein